MSTGRISLRELADDLRMFSSQLDEHLQGKGDDPPSAWLLERWMQEYHQHWRNRKIVTSPERGGR